MTCENIPTLQTVQDFNTDAKVLTEVVTGTTEQTVLPDSAGNTHKTLFGLQADYQAAIQAAGGVPLGVWSAGVTTFNAYNEYAVYNGIPYKPRATTTLPYVAQDVDPTIAPDATYVQPYADSLIAVARANNVPLESVNYLTTVSVTGVNYFYDLITETTYYSPVEISGTVTDTGSDINGVRTITVNAVDYLLVKRVTTEFDTVDDMKAYAGHLIGSKVSTGFTSWKIVDKETNWPTATTGLYAKPLNGLCFLDYGAAGDYFLEDKTINPSPTNDTTAILAAIADMDFDGSISGAGKGYYYDQTIKIDTNKKVRDAYFKQADGVTDYAVWFGDSTTDAPGNYEGRRLKIINVTFDPNQDCPVVARFRGLQNCYFDHLFIEPPVAPVSPTAQVYALMDGVLGTKFEKCSFQPKDSLSQILEMRLMRNLANTANAGNGLSSTSTTFSGCNLRRAQNLGTILGDSILFNEETIFEFTEDGFIVQETGSIAEFNNCYWEEIDNYKVYVRGVDSRNPATHVRVIGGKVQQGDNNGSEPNRAFFKVEHGYDVEMNGTIFQGRAQTRLVEFVAGGNGFIDGRVRINANYGQNPRKESGVVAGSVTIPISSNVATVTSVDHGLISGDVIDVVSNDQLDPINGTNLIIPNRVITYVDDDTFTYLTVGTSTSAVSANITYEKYKASSNCLANQDTPSSLLTQVGELRQVGANLYDFADCTTEFVEFSYDATGAVNEQVLSCNGRDRWSCDSVAFIKSVRYIDDSDVDSSRFATLRYGGVKYTRTNVTTVNNEDDAYASTVKYIAPYKIEPGEPVQAFAWSGGATYPRRLTVIIEVAKTGLTYVKDQ